jgi:hypothetical protein
MANRSYQNHNGIGFAKRKIYASEADITNINTAILNLRAAKEARNSTLFLKELRAATMLCQSLWRKHND